MKMTILVLAGLLCALCTIAQQVSAQEQGKQNAFTKISQQVSAYTPDTSAVPEDRMTRAIVKLRSLRGGFNINEAIEFKIGEERTKREMPEQQIDALSDYLTKGRGKRLLDNAVIHIYRNTYTYRELKRMIRFYKSAAGRKTAETFPVVMLESLAAGEFVKSLMK